jgi:LmbE family N-acetylglucosaminyl deacetylase
MLRLPARFVALACLAALVASSNYAPRLVEPARAQVRPEYSLGAAGLGQLLRRLQTTASVMHTGAHPDDEDSALIARLARGDNARVAYLSLTRGDGGQNILGPELFEALGVIRTEELLQARRLDGGEQFFARAFDFGFSKTRAETAAKWGERELLGDMVRAIRLYRPLVIISRFSGTPADGHGHHQFAGYLTPLAFRAAADPNQFPEQIAEGLRPWQARKLYVSASGGGGVAAPTKEGTSLRVETGRYDALFGRTYYEIAMEGRSQHKSQQEGRLELRGRRASGVRLLESRVPASGSEQSIFDGLDVSIAGIAQLTGLRDASIAEALKEIQQSAARALAEYDALDPRQIIGPLAAGLGQTRAARALLARSADPAEARADADFLLAQKEREFSEALERAAGVTFDALADTETVAPGESFTVALRMFVPESSPVRAGELRLRAPDGWRVERIEKSHAEGEGTTAREREAAQQEAYYRVTVPVDAPVTQPYWLAAPRDGDLFRWPASAPQGAPFAPALVEGSAAMEIGGAPVTITQPVQYRYADPVRGEVRRDLNVVPALAVALDPGLIIVPSGPKGGARRMVVRLTQNSSRALSGTVRLEVPAGWVIRPSAALFALSSKGQRTAVVFQVKIPGAARPGAYRIRAQAAVGGQTFDRAERVIDYPHIQTHRLYPAAETQVRVLDLKVAPVRVGYIMGSGDEVPDAIRQMGLEVTLLDETELSTGDLSRYDTIVVGIRASQVRPDFVANNNRLLDYVRNGGALIVQYQRTDYAERNLAPFPTKIGPRVTDETAPVTILQPAHPAFNFPNKITGADWQDWVQERSLYHFTDFSPQYVPLLESHDEGEPPQRGGQVYAQLGRGHYVYTAYAWFRQLPAGVPGAYRLFANLLSLPKAPSAPVRGGRRQAGQRTSATSRDHSRASELPGK